MARMVARKPLRLMGKTYRPGQEVPMEQVNPKVRRQLEQQRRVVPDEVRGDSGGGSKGKK